jgi:UvrD-like helicase C-terminal domain/AAA domain/Nuclease-related domain
MAELIPDRLPSRASKGEERLFALLKNLPDDHIVYYEPLIENRYPDFVVIGPDLGLLIVEVKGWYPNDLKAADTHEVVVLESRREIRRKHPLRQAREYMFGLMDCARKSTALRLLLNEHGEHKNRFFFPFGHLAVLANITAAQLRAHSLGDLSPVFPASRVITRDVLLAWEGLSAEDHKEALRACFDPHWPFPRMTDSQMMALRTLIHPEIRITPPEQGPKSGLAQRLDLKALDLDQERRARMIGRGHRILYGVAGSGKTVLLIARARLLARQSPETRVLVLCFNVSLSAYLQECLAECRNATVLHFDGWARMNGITRRVEGRRTETNDQLGERLLLHLEQGYAEARFYDTVLIDEAQDFAPSWFRCALAAMKEPNDGDLLIVGDGSQGLYRGNRAVSWEKLGIQARGRTIYKDFDLARNYRNTREILDLAAAFALPVSGEADGVLAVGVDPAWALRSTGQRPLLIQATNRMGECAWILLLVDGLLKGNHGLKGIDGPVEGREIGILYPRLIREERDLFEKLLKALGKRGPALWLSDPEDRAARRRVCEPGIKVQTIHSAKGLQYRAVILMWADLLPSGFPESDTEEERRLMYVALTRPEDMLFITCSKDSAFIAELRNTGKVDLA